MNTKSKTTTVSELPALLSGKPVGTRYLIEGYVETSGQAKDLIVKTLAADGYAKLKRESAEILEKNAAPSLPGFSPTIVAAARDALLTSYRGQVDAPERVFTDPYTEAPGGGYSIKEGEPAIYLLRLERLSPPDQAVTDPRVDIVRAKAALVRSLKLPAGRYMHAVKLANGKFKSVELL